MQTSTRQALAFAAVVAATAAGLVAVARSRRPHDPGAHALDAVPAGALLVATADLAALRASPVGVPFLKEGREIPGLGKVRDVCGFDPMDTLTEVAVVIPAGGDAGEFGLVAAGPIDDEKLLSCASKIIDARGGHAVTSPLGSFRSVRDATLSGGGGEIAVRPGGLLVLGAGDYLRRMIDAADGRTPTVRASVGHAFLGRQIGDASVRVTVVLSPEQRRTLAEELENVGAPGSPAASILAGALGVTLGPTVGVHAVVTCQDAAACASLARSLGEARDARTKGLTDRLAGIGALLAQIRIEPEGALVHARLELPAEQAAALAEHLATLQRGLRRQPAAAAPEADPGAAPRAAPPRPNDQAGEVIVPGAARDAGPGKGAADAGTKR